MVWNESLGSFLNRPVECRGWFWSAQSAVMLRVLRGRWSPCDVVSWAKDASAQFWQPHLLILLSCVRLTRWWPHCAPMLNSSRYHKAWCGLPVHPPARGSEYQCVHEQRKAAVACVVDLMLVSVLGVSPLCLPREAWPDFVCKAYPGFSDSETFPRVH